MKNKNPFEVQTQPLEIAFAPAVVYMPNRPGNKGGLFNLDGTPISSAINHRNQKIHISSQLDPKINIPSLPVIENDDAFFYIGSIFDHYGHFILESTTRLWPLLYWHRAFSGKYLYIGMPSVIEGKAYVQQIFNAYLLEPKKLVAYPVPCILKNVFIPAPSFELGYRVHTLFRETMQFVSSSLVKDFKKIHNTNPTPLYLSKSKLIKGYRGIINEIEIEEALRKMGVDILYPERLSLSEQIRELASRQFIIGTVGSAFHSLLFCLGGKTISGVHFSNHIEKSFIMIDNLCNNSASYQSIGNLEIKLINVLKKLENPSAKFRRTYQAQNPTKIAEQLIASLKTG